MCTLVTGLNGFTGSYIQSDLESHGHTVVGLSSDLTDISGVSAEISRIKPKVVMHLAGVSFVRHGEPNDFYEVNLIGTRNLLEALAKHAPDVRSVLLASSAYVYGNRTHGTFSEDAVADPANDYAVSKLAMEYSGRLWMDRLPIFIVRPFNYTGIGQDDNFLIPKIVKHFRTKSSFIELGNLDVWREFGDVRAVASIYRRLVELAPVGETLNVCTGQTHSLQEVIALCEKITGHRLEIRVNPEFVRSHEVRVLKGDNSRLKRLLGEWDCCNLEETLRWMLQEGNNC